MQPTPLVEFSTSHLHSSERIFIPISKSLSDIVSLAVVHCARVLFLDYLIRRAGFTYIDDYVIRPHSSLRERRRKFRLALRTSCQHVVNSASSSQFPCLIAASFVR